MFQSKVGGQVWNKAERVMDRGGDERGRASAGRRGVLSSHVGLRVLVRLSGGHWAKAVKL